MWEQMRRQCQSFEDLLRAAGAGDGYVRDWTITQPRFTPCLDLRLASISEVDLAGIDLRRRATHYAAAIAAADVPSVERLLAGTELSVVDGYLARKPA